MRRDTFQKKTLPPTNEAFYLTVTELHRSVFLCWMTLVGLDIHRCMRVIQLHLYCLCQLCLTQYLSLLTAVTAHAHVHLTEVAFKIVLEEGWGRNLDGAKACAHMNETA